jgi:hypothetical protein
MAAAVGMAAGVEKTEQGDRERAEPSERVDLSTYRITCQVITFSRRVVTRRRRRTEPRTGNARREYTNSTARTAQSLTIYNSPASKAEESGENGGRRRGG